MRSIGLISIQDLVQQLRKLDDTRVVYSPEQGTCGEIKLHFNTRFGKAVKD